MARKAWHDSAGRDGLGLQRLVPDWHGMAGTNWLGGAGIGVAVVDSRGMVRRGEFRQARLGMPRS